MEVEMEMSWHGAGSNVAQKWIEMEMDMEMKMSWGMERPGDAC